MMQNDVLSQQFKALSFPDAYERRLAAEALGETDERALYPLIKVLRDENPGVQDAAMRAIINIGGEVAAYMALPLLREDAFLRNTGRIILKAIGVPASPLLRHLFKDKDDDIRIFALDLIAEIRDCDYPEDIVTLLSSDPNPNVRSSAARSLGRLGYTSALPALHQALRDEEWVIISCLEALAELRDETSIEPIAQLLRQDLEMPRFAAIETLGSFGSGAASEVLLAYLPAASDSEKEAIVKSLVQAGIVLSVPESFDLLTNLFTNGDWDDRLIALRGLARLNDPRSVPLIIDIAGSLDPAEPGDDERLAAVREALAEFDANRSLIEVLDDPSIKYRGKVLAIETLACRHCTDAIPALIRLLSGNLREVRRASAWALASVDDDEATKALQDSIDDRDGHVRRAAANALGRIGDQSSFEPLWSKVQTERYSDVFEEMIIALLLIDQGAVFALLDGMSVPAKQVIGRFSTDESTLLTLSRDADVTVRISALSGLGNLRSDEAFARLLEALQEDNAEVKKAAIVSLGVFNRGFEILLPLLEDADTWVRLTAVSTLATSYNSEFVEALAPLLRDAESPVVFATIDALERLGGNRAGKELESLANHPDPDIRQRAASAMEFLS